MKKRTSSKSKSIKSTPSNSTVSTLESSSTTTTKTKSNNMAECMMKCQAFAPTILRIVVGLVFFMHGAQKLLGWFGGPGIAGVQGFFGTIGIPLPAFFAIVVAVIETVGGIALIIGLFTRISAALLAFIVLVAGLVVHIKNGFFLPGGIEFVLVLFAASLALMMSGPGKWAIKDKC